MLPSFSISALCGTGLAPFQMLQGLEVLEEDECPHVPEPLLLRIFHTCDLEDKSYLQVSSKEFVRAFGMVVATLLELQRKKPAGWYSHLVLFPCFLLFSLFARHTFRLGMEDRCY